MLVTDSGIIQKIRNTSCIVCGQRFSCPRAGKLYCSAKCKQFSFYHRNQITAIQAASKGIHETSVKLSIKEFENYARLANDRITYRHLSSRVNSKYFSENDEKRLARLEKTLSSYFKNETAKHLSLEEWSFFKTLYPNLTRERFVKLIDCISRIIIERIRGEEQIPKIKNDVLRIQFENHLRKICEGKILFN